MQIPADMHKWRTKFAWEMIAYAVVMLLMAGLALSAAWFFRTKFLTNPANMLFSTVSLAFAAAALVYSAVMCVQVSLSTRKHDVKLKELEKQRVPMTLERLREDLQPENQERFHATTLKMLQSSSPVVRASVEMSVGQLVEKVRKDVGSAPETEAELAKLEALVKNVLLQASTSIV
jgi:hypothetical protein